MPWAFISEGSRSDTLRDRGQRVGLRRCAVGPSGHRSAVARGEAGEARQASSGSSGRARRHVGLAEGAAVGLGGGGGTQGEEGGRKKEKIRVE